MLNYIIIIMIIPNPYITELLEYLIYSFKYYNSQSVLFKVIDKYLVHVFINDTKDISINLFDYNENYDFNPDVILLITEDLLVELYKDGISASQLLSKIKNGSIKSEKFKIFKFITFIKNFDLSTSKWNEFSKYYKKKFSKK